MSERKPDTPAMAAARAQIDDSYSGRERRIQARLAWNNWPDTPQSREILAAHEERDPISAVAWDRVVSAVISEYNSDFDRLPD